MSSRGKTLFAVALAFLIAALFFLRHRDVKQGPIAVAETNTLESVARLPKIKHSPTHTPNRTIINEQALDASPAEQARMQRMADNLLKPQLELDAEAAARKRAEWVERFHREQDPLLREEIITEMVQLDDPLTLKTMMDLLPGENHPGVREQILLMLGYLRSAVSEIAKLTPVVADEYRQSNNAEEKARILDMMSNLPTSETMMFMNAAFTAPNATAEERFHAAEGLFKMASRYEVDPELIRQFTTRLKHDAQGSSNPQERLMAAHALSAPGQNNRAFLRQLLNSETDGDVRKFLELASEEFPTK